MRGLLLVNALTALTGGSVNGRHALALIQKTGVTRLGGT